MTAITQIHLYIKEHYKPGDIITIHDIEVKLQHLRYSAISAALWKLGDEGILICSQFTGPHGCNEYMVDDSYMIDRGHEDREAPEPGLPRMRKCKKTVEHKLAIKDSGD
jgi:hypothetical protein